MECILNNRRLLSLAKPTLTSEMEMEVEAVLVLALALALALALVKAGEGNLATGSRLLRPSTCTGQSLHQPS